jgi:exodeoxyribonuclease X
MIIRVIDIESTGLDPAKDGAEPVEIAWTDVCQNGPGWHPSPLTTATLVKPSKPIPPQASAVHHITDAMVADAPSWDAVMAELRGDASGDIVYAAHYARFEQQFLKEVQGPWICTYKLAIHLAPKAPAYGLQVLRYWTGLELDPERVSPPHRAGPDSYVTAALLTRMLAKVSVDEAIAITERPIILPKLGFGTHAGVPLDDVPSDYLQWILDKNTFDSDVVATAKYNLQKRRAERR